MCKLFKTHYKPNVTSKLICPSNLKTHLLFQHAAASSPMVQVLSFLVPSLKISVTRGQTNTDNPAEYGYIRNRIVPLGMKRISIWTIRYSFDTLRNRSIENPVPFYPLRNTYKNYPFQTDNQTDNKLLRRAKSLKDDMAKKTLSKPKFSLRKCSLRESMFSNDPW